MHCVSTDLSLFEVWSGTGTMVSDFLVGSTEFAISLIDFWQFAHPCMMRWTATHVNPVADGW